MRRKTSAFRRRLFCIVIVATLSLSGCSSANDELLEIPEPTATATPSSVVPELATADVVLPSSFTLPTEAAPGTIIEFETAPADATPSFGPGVTLIRDQENANSAPEFITALVGQGTGGVATYDTYLSQLIVVDGWRDANGDVIKRKLVLKRPLALGTERAEYSDDVPSFGVVELLVQLNPERTRGVVLELSPAEQDTDLLAYGAELRVPVVVKVALGEFTLDRSSDYFFGSAEWGSNAVGLSLPASGDVIDPEALSDAETLWNDRARWTEESLDFIVLEMLDLKNEGWLEDGEPPLTDKQFRERVVLRSIDVDEGGYLSFGFSDDDIFWGHDIYLIGTLQEGFTSASLFG